MVPNVVGLVIVPSILVVNELYTPCKDKQYYLDRERGSRNKMIMFSVPFDNSECQGFLFHTVTLFLFHWLYSGTRSKSLHFEKPRLCRET